MEQLLLVTSCDLPAEIGASLWTHKRTLEGQTNGWTDSRDVGNSILDDSCIQKRYKMLTSDICIQNSYMTFSLRHLVVSLQHLVVVLMTL